MPEVDRNYSNKEFANRYRDEATTPLELKCIERLDDGIDEEQAYLADLKDHGKLFTKMNDFVDEIDSMLQKLVEELESATSPANKMRVLLGPKEISLSDNVKANEIEDNEQSFSLGLHLKISDSQKEISEKMRKFKQQQDTLTWYLEE